MRDDACAIARDAYINETTTRECIFRSGVGSKDSIDLGLVHYELERRWKVGRAPVGEPDLLMRVEDLYGDAGMTHSGGPALDSAREMVDI